MAEQSVKDKRVSWLTARVEASDTSTEMERFFFATDDNLRYYIDLRPANRSTELVAVSLVRDAYLHNKRIQIWYEDRAGRRWVKALNVYD